MAGAPAEQTGAAERLLRLVPGAIERLRALHESLQTERKALTSANATALGASTEAKELLLGALEEHNAEMYALLPALGLSADAQGLGQWLRHASGEGNSAPQALIWKPAPTERQRWQALNQQLRTAMEACRDTNLGNGLLASAGARDTQALLNILTGNASGGDTLTYDARGVQSPARSGSGHYGAA